MIAIRGAEAAKGYIPFAFFYWQLQSRVEGRIATLFAVLFWYFTVSRMVFVLFDWATTRYRVDPDGLRVTSGLFAKSTIVALWRDAATVQVSQPALHRACDVWMVRLGVGSSTQRTVVLDAVTSPVVAQIQQSFNAGREVVLGTHPQEKSTVPEESEPTQPAVPLFTMRRSDYALLSLTYGQFALIIPMVYGLYSELSSWGVLPTTWDANPLHHNLPTATLALMAAGAALLAGVYGWAVAWLRYRSFTVSLTPSGFAVNGGLISRENRLIRRQQVRGLRVRQNPAMRLLGRANLSLVVRERGARTRSNVVLPSVTTQRIDDVIADNFHDYLHLAHSMTRSTRRDAVVGTVSVATVAVAVGATLLSQGLQTTSMGALAGALMLLLATNWAWTKMDISADGKVLGYRRGYLWVSVYVSDVGAVGAVRSRQGPLARLSQTEHLTAWVFDGRPVGLRAWACPTAIAQRVMAAVEREPGITDSRQSLNATTGDCTR